MTKHFLLTFLPLLICAPASFADDSSKTEIIIKKGTTKPGRPHDEETAVTASYDNGTLYISFESYEGMATATLTNLFTGESDSWTFSTATQPSTHHFGSAPGTYTISITTSEASYQGVFAID